MNRSVWSLIWVAAIVLLALPIRSQEGTEPEAKKTATGQYLYMLKLAPRFQVEANWAEQDQKVVAEHFRHLQELLNSGKLILAGKTDEDLAATFGIVIFEAPSEQAAREIMESDPAVKNGLMIATLHPYHVALKR